MLKRTDGRDSIEAVIEEYPQEDLTIANGTAADPSVSFVGTNNGFYYDGGVNVTTSGTKRFGVADALVTSSVPLKVQKTSTTSFKVVNDADSTTSLNVNTTANNVTVSGSLITPSLKYSTSSGDSAITFTADTITLSTGNSPSSFQLNDVTDTMTFKVDNGVKMYIGSTTIDPQVPVSVIDATDSSGLGTGSLRTDGGAAITKKLYVGTGLYLPTAGGTPTELNYYEYFSIATQVNQIGTSTAFHSTPQSPTVQFIRIGSMVTIHVGLINSAAIVAGAPVAMELFFGAAFPSRFRTPGATFYGNARVFSGGIPAVGTVAVTTGGLIRIYYDSSTVTAFTSNAGANPFSITYSTVA